MKESDVIFRNSNNQLATAIARKMHLIFFSVGGNRTAFLSTRGSFVVSNSGGLSVVYAETVAKVLSDEQITYLSGYAAALADSLQGCF